MDILIVTGLSGAGKSQAADYLEDLGYFCVDNMPVALLPRFAEFCRDAGERFEKVALVTDVRSQSRFDELFEALEALHRGGVSFSILYMEAPAEVIVRRYKETRRAHPLAASGATLQEAVETEKKLLAPVRERADHVIDTGDLTLGQLHNEICALFAEAGRQAVCPVTVMSFGYKYGIPLEADLVWDVRFLPNPYYEEELRSLTGLDARVAAYVFSSGEAQEFLDRLAEELLWLLPRYRREGKSSLTVAVGCTGGRHRSVALAGALTDRLIREGVNARSFNRDCGRGNEA